MPKQQVHSTVTHTHVALIVLQQGFPALRQLDLRQLRHGKSRSRTHFIFYVFILLPILKSWVS